MCVLILQKRILGGSIQYSSYFHKKLSPRYSTGFECAPAMHVKATK